MRFFFDENNVLKATELALFAGVGATAWMLFQDNGSGRLSDFTGIAISLSKCAAIIIAINLILALYKWREYEFAWDNRKAIMCSSLRAGFLIVVGLLIGAYVVRHDYFGSGPQRLLQRLQKPTLAEAKRDKIEAEYRLGILELNLKRARELKTATRPDTQISDAPKP